MLLVMIKHLRIWFRVASVKRSLATVRYVQQIRFFKATVNTHGKKLNIVTTVSPVIKDELPDIVQSLNKHNGFYFLFQRFVLTVGLKRFLNEFLIRIETRPDHVEILNYFIKEKSAWNHFQSCFLKTFVDSQKMNSIDEKMIEEQKIKIMSLWYRVAIETINERQLESKFGEHYLEIIKVLLNTHDFSTNHKTAVMLSAIINRVITILAGEQSTNIVPVDYEKQLDALITEVEKQTPTVGESLANNIEHYLGMFFVRNWNNRAHDLFEKTVDERVEYVEERLFTGAFISSIINSNDLTKYEQVSHRLAKFNDVFYPENKRIHISHAVASIAFRKLQATSSNLRSNLMILLSSWAKNDYILDYRRFQLLKGWLRKNLNNCVIHETNISNGICKETGIQLPNKKLTSEQQLKLSNAVWNWLLTDKSKEQKDIKYYNAFRENVINKEIEVVIDGMNIIRITQNLQEGFSNLQKVCHDIDTYYRRPVKKMVIFQKHMLKREKYMSVFSVNSIDNLEYYFTRNEDSDDRLLIYAGLLNSKIKICSQDSFRDHTLAIKGVGLLFKRWLDQTRIMVPKQLNKGKLQFPKNYEMKAQFVDGFWFIPSTTSKFSSLNESDKEAELLRSIRWTCFKVE